MPQSALESIEAVKLTKFRSFVEPNGTLVPVTANREIPFPIARIFYVYGVEAGLTRGDHAHIECKQLLVCVHGACEVLYEDGAAHGKALLDSPDKALFVPPGIWTRQQYREKGTVLIVFTDRPYNERDYIREYDAYLQYRGIPRARAVNE